jgi:hypothetical protein
MVNHHLDRKSGKPRSDLGQPFALGINLDVPAELHRIQRDLVLRAMDGGV